MAVDRTHRASSGDQRTQERIRDPGLHRPTAGRAPALVALTAGPGASPGRRSGRGAVPTRSRPDAEPAADADRRPVADAVDAEPDPDARRPSRRPTPDAAPPDPDAGPTGPTTLGATSRSTAAATATASGCRQYGARGRALAGQDAPTILAHYYQGTTLGHDRARRRRSGSASSSHFRARRRRRRSSLYGRRRPGPSTASRRPSRDATPRVTPSRPRRRAAHDDLADQGHGPTGDGPARRAATGHVP